jgi:hypothetical protein
MILINGWVQCLYAFGFSPLLFRLIIKYQPYFSLKTLKMRFYLEKFVILSIVITCDMQ